MTFFKEFKTPFYDEIDAGGGAANAGAESTTASGSVADSTTPVTETTPQKDNVVDITTTQAFSQRLKESTQKAVDAEYDRLYGAEYGIHTKSEYDAAIAKQQAEAEKEQFQKEHGIDPSVIDERVKAALENHPAVLSAKEQSNKLVRDNAALELAKVASNLGIKEEIKSWADVEKLPKFEQIKESILKGNDIVASAKLAYFDDVVNGTAANAQKEAIQKMAANNTSSPGSLAGGTDSVPSYTREQVDKMSQADIMKNYDAVMASMKKWK